MKCPNCNKETENDSKFCSNCGAKMELHCPKCNDIIKRNDKFCSNCGYKLEDEKKNTHIETNIEKDKDAKRTEEISKIMLIVVLVIIGLFCLFGYIFEHGNSNTYSKKDTRSNAMKYIDGDLGWDDLTFEEQEQAGRIMDFGVKHGVWLKKWKDD